MECDLCGHREHMGYTCKKCGEHFCKEHRLPESHDCIGLKIEKAEREIKRQEGEQQPWFKGADRGKSENSTKGERSTKRRKTKRERLEEEQSEKYKSPDVNVDGSVGSSGYESEIKSSSTNSNRVKSSIRNFVSEVKTRFRLWRVQFRLWSNVWRGLGIFVFGVALILGFGMVGYGPTAGMSPMEAGESATDSAADLLDEESIDEEEVEQLVIEKVNEERAEQGLAPVQQDESLRHAARSHSDHMVEMDTLAHDIGDSTFERRLSDAGCATGAENIGQSWIDERVDDPDGTRYVADEEDLAESLVVGWMNSPPHRENLLDGTWSVTGVGVSISDDGKAFSTQKFCA